MIEAKHIAFHQDAETVTIGSLSVQLVTWEPGPGYTQDMIDMLRLRREDFSEIDKAEGVCHE